MLLTTIADLSTLANDAYDQGMTLTEALNRDISAGTLSAGWTLVDLGGFPQDDHGYSQLLYGGQAFFAVNPLTHEAALVFRGTEPDSLQDLFSALLLAPVPWFNDVEIIGEVFQTFVQPLMAPADLEARFRDFVTAAENYATSHGYQLFTAGHGVGGAAAGYFYENSSIIDGGVGVAPPPTDAIDAEASNFIEIQREYDFFSMIPGNHWPYVIKIVDDAITPFDVIGAHELDPIQSTGVRDRTQPCSWRSDVQ